MFKIDHPLDPAHKYLYDSFVESPDMMNIYKRRGYPPCKRRSGDSNAGMVWRSEPRLPLPVYLPWRICCGLCRRGTCQQSIQDWRRSRRPEGILADHWHSSGRLGQRPPDPVEEEKSAQERGYYIHPELYGAPEEKQIERPRQPQMMERMKERPVPVHPVVRPVAQTSTLLLSK